MRQTWQIVGVMATLAACAPTSTGDFVPISDASTDVRTDAAAPPCTSDRQCTPSAPLCDRDRGVCVACRSASDCGGMGRACIASRCVPVTNCTSSRQCPGQVCNPTLGYCVECNGDNDCASTQRCVDNRCAARPRMCASSRQCSDLALVCDAAQGICVECVGDNDCAANAQFCGAGNRCLARVCRAEEARCTMAGAREVCNARGNGYDTVGCASNQSCRDGTCVERVCVPGARRCPMGNSAAVETCNPDGLDDAHPVGLDTTESRRLRWVSSAR